MTPQMVGKKSHEIVRKVCEQFRVTKRGERKPYVGRNGVSRSRFALPGVEVEVRRSVAWIDITACDQFGHRHIAPEVSQGIKTAIAEQMTAAGIRFNIR